jgi:hypothetical protein
MGLLHVYNRKVSMTKNGIALDSRQDESAVYLSLNVDVIHRTDMLPWNNLKVFKSLIL